MMIVKHGEMSEILDWFEKDNGQEDFWDIDMMLDWVGSDKKILEHPGLPAFIGFWCDSDICLYAEFAHEFTHKWPGVQTKFDDLAKSSYFSLAAPGWVINS